MVPIKKYALIKKKKKKNRYNFNRCFFLDFIALSSGILKF